ncbi:MAG TPA: VWA domain-containing protein [Spirochaetota bacterium]|nr:VWA domain-containing protein [Spirochaetota bacterium]
MQRIILFFTVLMMFAVFGCAGMKAAEDGRGKAPTIDTASLDDEVKSVEKKEDGGKPAVSAPKKKNGKDTPLLREVESDLPGEKSMDRTSRKEDAAGRGVKKGAYSETDRPAPPSASGLKAGFSDDNKQFNYFVNFQDKYGEQVRHYPINIRERISIRVIDSGKRSIANAKIEVFYKKKALVSGKTYSDGIYLFFPSEYDTKYTSFRATVTVGQLKREVLFDRQGKREITVPMEMERPVQKNVPLDIVFILDTTGSMGEEISRLKSTIEIINLNLASLSTRPKIRFGMVLYKDKDDEYLTKIVPLTGDLDKFRSELDRVNASGGGDEPEDLQSALQDTIKKIAWNTDGIRLAYIITDAPPHLDYGQEYTYATAAKDARRAGIKIFSVGTGGLNLMGEYILRQIAQYTSAAYIFLTYGEKGESEGGREGSVSHHTGANFQTDKLESIIIRLTKEELSHLTDAPLESGESYIQATKIEEEQNEETLRKLFDMTVVQLVDYSSIGIAAGTPVSLIPFSSAEAADKSNAEYFAEQMNFAISRNRTFKTVERRDLQKILKELELGMTGMVEDENAVKVGKLIGARMIVTGRLYAKNKNYEVFLKLLRVETGEVLSVNKLMIDRRLGISR